MKCKLEDLGFGTSSSCYSTFNTNKGEEWTINKSENNTKNSNLIVSSNVIRFVSHSDLANFQTKKCILYKNKELINIKNKLNCFIVVIGLEITEHTDLSVNLSQVNNKHLRSGNRTMNSCANLVGFVRRILPGR